MATTQKIRNDIAKTKEKIAEQQKRLRALETQLAEEENLEIVRMVKAVKMDNKELTAFLKAYASGMISLPEGMLQEGNTENEETEGYARNFILKKNKGVEANGKNLNDLKLKKANDDKIAQQQYEDAQELGKKIEAGKIEVAIKMGEGGKAFGSVSSKEIAEEVKKQMDLTIDKKKVQLKEAIRTLGTHNVPVKLHPKVTAELKVVVKEEA